MEIKRYMFKDKMRSIQEIADMTGKSWGTVKRYIKKGLRSEELERALSLLREAVKIEIDGVAKTYAEWAKYSGLSEETIRKRYNRGKRGKELIEIKNHPKTIKKRVPGYIHKLWGGRWVYMPEKER